MKDHDNDGDTIDMPISPPWGKGVCLPPPVEPMDNVIGNRAVASTHPYAFGKTFLIIMIAFCVSSILVSPGHASAHSIATGTGRITGQLLDGSRKNTPLAGQTVTLQMSQDGSARDLTTSKTNTRGVYTFTNLATDKAITYALYISYQGAQYTSNIITFASKSAQQMNLTVYDATSSTSNIAIIQSTVLIREPNAQKSTFGVSELFDFKNLGLQTFVGSLDASQGKPNALFFPLPKGARSISLDQGFAGYKPIQEADGFATNAAVYPGDTAFSLSFEVPYLSSVYDFDYRALYPTVLLSFMVDPSIHASAAALNSQGIVTAQQHPYHVFSGSKLLTNQEIHINFEGLPHPSSSASPVDLKTIWLIVGFLLLLAIITTVSVLSRLRDVKKRHHKSNNHASKNTHVQHEQTHRKPASTPKERSASTSKERKEALMHELLELDKEFENGTLSHDAYQERRARTKARLRTLLSEQEAPRK